MHGQEEGQVIIHTETKTGHNRQNSPRGFFFPFSFCDSIFIAYFCILEQINALKQLYGAVTEAKT